MENNIDEIRRDISNLKGTIDNMRVNLSVLLNQKPPIAKSKSPISLTDEGVRISKELGADEIIEKNWYKISDDLQKNITNKNAYDIQKYCFDTVDLNIGKFISDDDILQIKEYAFKDGSPLLYYSPIFAIKIRDRYFDETGININEVDNNVPNIFTDR